MVIASPLKQLHFPKDYAVPELIFAPCDTDAANELLLLIPPGSKRPKAQPLSLSGVKAHARNLAQALLSPDAEGGAWKKGDVLFVFSENQPDYLAYLLGTMLAGATAALANPQYKADELGHLMGLVKPRAILASRQTLALAQDGAQELTKKTGLSAPPCYVFDEDDERSAAKCLLERGAELERQGSDALEHVKIEPAKDAAIYCFSSGTSGMPKAVALSHHNIVANIVQSAVMLSGRTNKPLVDDGNWYDQPLMPPPSTVKQLHVSVLPQFHCYGMLMSFVALHTATPCVVFARYNLEQLLESIQERKATFMFVVPPIRTHRVMNPNADCSA